MAAKKAQLTYKEIEDRLRVLKDNAVPKEEIGYTILYSFGKPERELERFREGKGVIKTFDGLLVKGLFCYKASTTLRFASELEELKQDMQVLKATPKIIAVSDGTTIRAWDTRQKETFEQKVDRLYCDFEFFYPLAGVERIEYVEESPADIKAAEKLAKLHDEIRAYNEFTSDSDLHDLNTFIARLLFCFFAEDTGIFPQNAFTGAIQQFTMDARNLKDVLEQLFRFMGGRPIPDGVLKTYCQNHFDYVGGGLFDKSIYIPELSMKARKIIIESGDLDWQNINPDIFGSMIQAAVNPDVRATQGMHYTSVPNIMKVINPLFLDELRGEYDKIGQQYRKLRDERTTGTLNESLFYKKCQAVNKNCDQLLTRMSRMKFFDPACGSGNFLIITYKMLRQLEMDIFDLKKLCTPHGALPFIESMISLQQFYGIEILDFPHEVTMLSLWLAEHQMNKKMNEYFGVNRQALPLKDINNIRCGNACRIDWNDVCPHTKEEEVFVFGNPPYLGYSKQSATQKEDLQIVCVNINNYKKLDYISCWFVKGYSFIKKNNAFFAFVTTNSITQGEQVAVLWKYILNTMSISFAYKSFMWKNNAKDNAMVAVTIIGVENQGISKNHKIFDDESYKIVDNINPYIIDFRNVFVEAQSTPLSEFPEMIKGCSPVDDNNLLFSEEEKAELIDECHDIEKYIFKYVGAEELVKGQVRYCLLFDENNPDTDSIVQELSCKSSTLKQRIQNVKYFREKSTKDATREWASRPYIFVERKYRPEYSIVVPQTGSERREYLPIGIEDEKTVLSNAVRVIYTGKDCNTVLFGILESAIHMVWVRTVAGRMKTDMQYSNTICYNTFPFPKISDVKKQEIEEAATNVLMAREPYLTKGKTLADLYDPDTMPDDLREAHHKLDDIVESCYPGYPFASDEARLECLFKMYEKMTKKG